MAAQSGLVTRKLGKSFPGVRALDSFDFAIRPGEVHCLLGENGAGKSTFINILSGSFADYEGEIEIDGAPVSITTPAQAKALQIATIHQEQCLVPAMTVEENIHLGTEPRRNGIMVDRQTARTAARDVLDRLGVKLDLNARVRDLSTAEAQMVEIAKALVLDARILILDERPPRSRTARPRSYSASSASSRRAAPVSSTSRIGCRKSPRSPTPSPSCATAGRSANSPPPTPRRNASSN